MKSTNFATNNMAKSLQQAGVFAECYTEGRVLVFAVFGNCSKGSKMKIAQFWIEFLFSAKIL